MEDPAAGLHLFAHDSGDSRAVGCSYLWLERVDLNIMSETECNRETECNGAIKPVVSCRNDCQTRLSETQFMYLCPDDALSILMHITSMLLMAPNSVCYSAFSEGKSAIAWLESGWCVMAEAI